MEVTFIERKDDLYFVTFSPGFWGKLFGKPDAIKKYKQLTDKTYTHGDSAGVYIDQTGEVLGWTHDLTKQLDNFKRSW